MQLRLDASGGVTLFTTGMFKPRGGWDMLGLDMIGLTVPSMHKPQVRKGPPPCEDPHHS